MIAAIFLAIIIIGPYLAFTGHVPFTSYGYEVKATFSNGVNISTRSPVRIAGVEVGEVIGVERDGDATTVSFTVSGVRPPDPQGRLRRDPAADLPRGQLLHRTRPRQPKRAGTEQRRNDPGQPHLDRGPARRDPDRAAVAGPRQPRQPAGGLRHGALRQADRRRRQEPAARSPGHLRRRGAQRGLQIRRRRRPLRRPDDQRPAGHEPARPLAGDLRRRAHLRRLRPARRRAAGPDRQLRDLHRRPLRPVVQPRNDAPALRPDPEHGAQLARQPQPGAAAAARLRDRAAAGRRRTPGPDLGLEAVAQAGAPAALGQGGRRRRPAAQGSDSGPRRRRPGGQVERPAAAQPPLALRQQGPDPDRQRDDRRPVLDRRPQLP